MVRSSSLLNRSAPILKQSLTRERFLGTLDREVGLGHICCTYVMQWETLRIIGVEDRVRVGGDDGLVIDDERYRPGDRQDGFIW